MFSSNTSQVSSDANYIEDVFSTWLYTGNGSTQTITNGIDLAGEGGLTWIKSRSNATENLLYDTARGAYNYLISSTTGAQSNGSPTGLSAFNSDGFSVAGTTIGGGVNGSGATYASWTFREQSKFFDIVTYTGNGSNRTISHSLGSVPGCIIVKRTDAVADWQVYHRSLANTEYLVLNSTAAKATGTTRWNSTTPTSTVFSLGTDSTVNANGATYVAYLFAHDAGGFGLTGTDNVISCGSFTGPTATVDLGYEPQWLLTKRVDSTGNWMLMDTMRGLVGSSSSGGVFLQPNTSNAENSQGQYTVNATGFNASVGVTSTFIYIAIRRGPMKTPTSGTSVFGLNARTGTDANATVTGSAGVTDLAIVKNRGSTPVWLWASRLTGTGYLSSNATTAETAAGTTILQSNPWDVMDGVKVGTTSTITNASANTYINYLIDRAPGFFDEVCYTGGGSSTYIYDHNLGVVPELIIIKSRSNGTNVNYWPVKIKSVLGQQALALNSTNPNPISSTYWASADDTATQFRTRASNTAYDSNATGYTYVAYLFASCPGVSKVFNFTGTGTTQIIDCGFTAGARFVLIKRTDSTGDWYVWDSARGIVSGNEPYLLLNSAAAEVTGFNFIAPASAGFVLVNSSNVNLNGASYIGLAIA